MTDPIAMAARRYAKRSYLCLAANFVICGLVAAWGGIVASLIGPGDPPGPQFAFAAFFLPVLALGGVLYLGSTIAGIINAMLGLQRARSVPERPYFKGNLIVLVIHTIIPVFAILGRFVVIVM